jgi:hypothetical protein
VKGSRNRALTVAAVLVVVTVVTTIARRDRDRPPADGEGWEPLDRVVTVEVMNGGSRPGAARDASLRLRRAGLDVVWWGNVVPELSDSTARTIRVFARRGDTTGAGRVAAVLGAAEVVQLPDADRLVDLTVVVP